MAEVLSETTRREGEGPLLPRLAKRTPSEAPPSESLREAPPRVALHEQDERYWASRSDEERGLYLAQLEANHDAILQGFFALGVALADEYKRMRDGNQRTRRRMIWMTGVLAMLNILIATEHAPAESAQGPWAGLLRFAKVALPTFVALYAAILAILSNLETLENYVQRAQHFRKSREMAIDAGREFEMHWNVYVRPFSTTPTACVNATSLYRRIVAKDKDVRAQVMETAEQKKVAA